MAVTRNRYNLSGDTCYQGLSTDSKPTDQSVPINALFLELDTGKFYYFDGSTWSEAGNNEGGGITLKPKLTVTVVNPYETDMDVYSECPILVESHLETCSHTVEANGELVLNFIVPKTYSIITNEYAYLFSNVLSGDGNYYGELSNLVNVELDDDVGYKITDPTQDASCTATLVFD